MEISESFGVTDYHFNVIEARRMIKENTVKSAMPVSMLYLYRTPALEGTLEIPWFHFSSFRELWKE